MKKNIFYWQFLGFLFVSICGTLLHFLYEWSNNNIIFAIFSSVNESTWEHMKLLYYPLLIFSIIQFNYFKTYKNYWNIKLIGIITGLTLIPVLFYTYNGIFGKSPDWVNILIFFISAAISFIIESYLFKNNKIKSTRQTFSFIIILLISILFITFTFNVPKLPIFLDSVTKTYGIKNF